MIVIKLSIGDVTHPDFNITDEEADEIVEICKGRLEEYGYVI